MTKTEYIIAISVISFSVFAGLVVYGFATKVQPNLGGADVATTPIAVTNATTTINSTSTLVCTSPYQICKLQNLTNVYAYCAADGKTDASSSIKVGQGVALGPSNVTTSTAPSIVTFGRCYPGSVNCHPVSGNVNCIGDAQTNVLKFSY